MAVVAGRLVSRLVRFGTEVVCVASACHPSLRQEAATVVGAVAMGADSNSRLLNSASVTVHLGLPDILQIMRVAIGRDRNVRMTDRALRELTGVPLQRLAVYVIVGLQRGILGVR